MTDLASEDHPPMPNALTVRHASASTRGSGSPTDVQKLLDQKIRELEADMRDCEGDVKEAVKSRKKQLREMEKLIKDASLSPADKLQAVQERCIKATHEVFRVEKERISAQHQLEKTKKQFDAASSEVNRLTLMKDKLQEVCRELQRQNKCVLEDACRSKEEEEAKRLALTDKLSVAIQDITGRLDTQKDETTRIMDENSALRDKLTAVLKTIDAQQKNWEDQLHRKSLEAELANAKFEQQSQINEQLKAQCEAYETQASLLQRTNDTLQQQLTDVSTNLRSTLTQSNELLSKLTKTNDVLKKENISLMKELKDSRESQAQSTTVLLQLHEERSQLTATLGKMKSKMQSMPASADMERVLSQKRTLENLCRTLQSQLRLSPASPSATDAAASVSPARDSNAQTAEQNADGQHDNGVVGNNGYGTVSSTAADDSSACEWNVPRALASAQEESARQAGGAEACAAKLASSADAAQHTCTAEQASA